VARGIVDTRDRVLVMISHEFLHAPDDVAVMSRQGSIPAGLTTGLAGRTVHAYADVDALLAVVIARRIRTVVIDHECPGADAALERINALSTRPRLFVIVIVSDTIQDSLRGADVLTVERSLLAAISVADPATRQDRPVALDRLLGVSMLGRPLDHALELAADQLAIGFGADRCVISVREDSTGGAASGTGTWSALTWSYTAERCRSAARGGVALIAPSPEQRHTSPETYLAVPLDTSFGPNGFLGLVMSRPHQFSADVREALVAVGARLSSELSWRGMHERASDELDRLVNGPGLDPLLGIWNQTALSQLTAMQLSLAMRTSQPLSVAVLDIVDLAGINHRYGHEVGDRLLRRIADTVRTTVREEDLIGRWAGDSIAIVLYGISPEGGQRMAERIQAALAERPLEIARSGSMRIPVTIGLATSTTNEGAIQLVTRGALAARKAQHDGQHVTHAVTQPSNPRLSGEITLPPEDITSTIGGTYRLLHEISRGGMGVVYRAQDRALERPVAIKMLRPDLAEDPELVERFRIEASMLAHIRHPNLVQIYSFGTSGGDSYFVMELVEGESLEQACERHLAEHTATPLADVPAVITQIASALDALHERGIVHRDVKPANVIRDPFRNRSVLVDVGIARRYGQDARSAGTPGFIAPEVFSGGEASVRSDVYGLAATAYTMLTLKRPWGDGDLVTLLTRQCGNELTPPSELRPELAPVDDLFKRALDADPTKRPASASELARELASSLPVIVPRDRSNDPDRAVRKALASTAPQNTRGVVFRSLPRAIGVRDAERLRHAISDEEPELADILANTAPLAWVPTALFQRLLEVGASRVSREPNGFARDFARATVRGSFRRFFPASAATLVPESTLSAIRNVWSRYQSWGDISSMPVQPTEHVVRLSSMLRDPLMCAWTSGLLEQLVVLSGAKQTTVVHDLCAADGAEACMFRVRWEH
jgi:diguanylate cyclase (GGDEF)-like protein